MTNSELVEFKQYVSNRLSTLTPFLQKYALGDFSATITIPDVEDEFTELLVGLTLMVEDFREMLQELQNAHNDLTIKNEELKKQSHLISGIANTTPALIYVYDMETQSNVYSNPGIENLLGYSPEEILEMGEELFVQTIHPDDLPHVFAFQSKILAAEDGEILEIEYQMKNCEDQWLTFRSYESPFLRNVDNSVKQKIGVAIDISERIKGEKKLKEHTQELEMSNRQLENFKRMAVGREQRMIELKRQVNQLSDRLGEDPVYDTSFAE